MERYTIFFDWKINIAKMTILFKMVYRYIHFNVHSSIVNNNQDMQAT